MEGVNSAVLHDGGVCIGGKPSFLEAEISRQMHRSEKCDEGRTILGLVCGREHRRGENRGSAETAAFGDRSHFCCVPSETACQNRSINSRCCTLAPNLSGGNGRASTRLGRPCPANAKFYFVRLKKKLTFASYVSQNNL